MRRRMLCIALVFMLVVSFSGGIYADGGLTSISGAVLNDQLNFKLNGVSVVPVGDDGTPVLPISYNGTTYLPVRAIGYLLGLGIDYEGASKTVLITSTTSKSAPVAIATTKSNQLIAISNVVLNGQLKFKLDNVAAIPVGDDGTPVLPISYNGTTYLPVRAIGYLLGLGINYEGATKTVLITKGTNTTTTTQKQVWKLTDTKFVDGSKRTDSVLMGTTSKIYDLTSYEGTANNLTISWNRYDQATGKLLAGVTYQSIWSNPPEYLVPGNKYSISYELKTMSKLTWSPPQQTIYLNQGLSGVFFASADGTTYITKDSVNTYTTTKAIEKGTKGSTRTIVVTNGCGFSSVFTYTWID